MSATRRALLLSALALPLAACTAGGQDREGASPAPQDTTDRTGTAMSTDAPTTALLDAARTGETEAARAALADGADLDGRDGDGRTALLLATRADHVELALLLLEDGADPDAKDDIQDSAFLYAGAEGRDEILSAAIAHGADVRSTNRYGGTALIPASEHGHTSTVAILLEAGVPVDHVNNLGWTALHEAIVLGDGGPDQVETVRLLLAGGADPSIPDGNGTSPRDLAAQRGFDEIVALLEDAEDRA
ncbi:ankyrin repeat domain-containing protein [Brachybacterium hainanense]|uniref:Ankyrin repeat domain-containing protein n=1 Tax=Brachybacterium hainanense TaxID=1541174 RepID=A0ABV6RBW8_9MICO